MRELRQKNAGGRTPTTGATGSNTSQDIEKGISVTISMQSIGDVLVAIVTTVGIAVAVSLAIVAAGVAYERRQARIGKAGRRGGAVPPQHSTQSDQAGELLLR